MAFTPIANTVDVSINWNQGALLRVTKMAFQYTVGRPTLGDLQAITDGIEANVIPRMQAIWVTNCYAVSIVARDMHDSNGLQFANTLSASYPGLRAGDPRSSQDAAVITKRSNLPGRSKRGRMYMSGLSENDVVWDTISNALLALLLNLAQEYLRSYLSLRFRPAVASQTLGNSTLIQSVDSTTGINSMNRRLTGRGP